MWAWVSKGPEINNSSAADGLIYATAFNVNFQDGKYFERNGDKRKRRDVRREEGDERKAQILKTC
jgi:hypothetical protein